MSNYYTASTFSANWQYSLKPSCQSSSELSCSWRIEESSRSFLLPKYVFFGKKPRLCEYLQKTTLCTREALRAEATRWSHSKNPVFRFGQSGEALIDLWKECKFDVDLHAALFTDTGDNENNSIFRGNQMRSLLDDQESTPATVSQLKYDCSTITHA